MTKHVRLGVAPRFSRAQLDAEAASRAGCHRLVVAQTTRTLVGLYEAEPAGLDPEGGRWATVCEAHGIIVNHETKATARSWLSHPEEWCSGCQGHEEVTADAYSHVYSHVLATPPEPVYLTCWIENDEVFAHSSNGNHVARHASLAPEDRFDDAKKALNRMIACGHGHRVEVLVGRATETLGFRTADCEVIA